MISVTPSQGFNGSVAVTIAGLPAGAAAKPAAALSIDSGTSQSLTVVTSDSTPTGSATLTLTATSGSLSHRTTITLTTTPAVTTSQSGTVLYLQANANGHSARIGVDTHWGGAITDVTYDGVSMVNAHDPGREVQPAFYDGADQYPWPDINTSYGWDPVLAGDFHGNGTPVEGQQVTAGSLYTRATPLQWYPDSFGGSASMPVPSDLTVEQTITLAPGTDIAFQIHYRLTHNGTDTHYNTGQEFPAVYLNAAYTTLVYYTGVNPWTGAALTQTPVPLSSDPALVVFTPELWAALVDSNGMGLAVYVPGQYPRTGAAAFPSTGMGPTDNATVYMNAMTSLTFTPGNVIEADMYLVPGQAASARAAIYAIHHSLPASDMFTPLATTDVPAPGAAISGPSASVAGWAFDNVAVDFVQIYVDGTLRGTATLGGSRPDVAAAYPHIAPENSGWNYALDTTALSNGPHSLSVHARDVTGNEALVPPLAVTVSN
jgi:Bacterial Ig domain